MESQSTPNLEKIELKNSDNKRLRSKSCFLAWCALGLSLVMGSGLFSSLGFFYLKNKEQLAHDHQQLASLQTQISQSRSNNERLQQHVSQLENFIEKKFSANNNTLLLADAKQLLQLAQYNLIYFHHSENALAALVLADKELAEIISPDTRLEDLRHSIADYIDKLKALPAIDIPASLARIQALKKQLTQLPLLLPTAAPHPPPLATANPSEDKWMDKIQNNLRSFRQFIVIRHLNKPIKPLLPEIEQQYLQHNLLLLLEQAQWALLHNEASVYQSSLEEIQESIKGNFDSDSSMTQTALQSITELKQVDLQAPPSDLSPLLESITLIEKTPLSENAASAITTHDKEPF